MEEKNLTPEEELGVVILTDEETGKDCEFQFVANAEIDGSIYYALMPTDEKSEDWVILRASIDGDDVVFESIEDDDEFEKVEDYFNDLLFSEVDYDEN